MSDIRRYMNILNEGFDGEVANIEADVVSEDAGDKTVTLTEFEVSVLRAIFDAVSNEENATEAAYQVARSIEPEAEADAIWNELGVLFDKF